jgi:tetratricopeptide (TPR) repeat protein
MKHMRWSIVIGAAAAALVAGGVLAWTTIRQDREFQRLIATGDVALAQDQTFAAIEAFSGALVLKPDSMLAHLKRGDAYRHRGELAASLRDLRAASALEPTAPRPVELLGDVNAGMGRYERAIEHYRRFISLDDRSPRVLYKLAHTYFRNGQPAKAIEPLREALSMDGRLSEAHYLLGLCLRETGHHQDAIASLGRALELAPGLTMAREELARLFDTLHRDRENLEQLEALAALEPGRADRLVRVGLAYARQGRTLTAIITLSRAAERYPDDPAVHTALGRVWLERASPDNAIAIAKAREALEVAASRSSATSETLALYGRALFLAGSADAAVRALQQAISRFPVEPLAYRYLAEAAARTRDSALAQDADLQYTALTEP